MRALVAVLTLCLASLSIATAATYLIRPDGTGDYPTIQAGLAAASPGDTVSAACGTYYEHDIALTPGVCLRSETGLPDCVTIDAQSQGRAVACADAGGGTLLEGFTITGGHVAGSGGGLLLANAPILIARCVFRQNHAEHGAACQVTWSNAQFEDCSFLENAADVPGPNMYFAGGALYCYACSPELSGCEFIGNSAQTWGGGVFLYGGAASPQFIDCLFEDNIAGHLGGGMDVDAGATPTISRCVFRGNQGPSGGAIFVGTPSLTVERTLFDGNSAVSGGAVYFGWSGSAGSLTACTLVGNAAISGGGIFVDATAGTPILAQTIVVFGAQGQGVLCGGDSTPILTCCDVYGNEGGDWDGSIAGQLGVDGNISAYPYFCRSDNPDVPYALYDISPCAPGSPYHPEGCDLMGAFPIGCEWTAAQDLGGSAAQAPKGSQGGLWTHPNPSLGPTTISFEAPGGLRAAELLIFDVAGREVRRLVLGDLAPGRQQVIWDGLAAGQPVHSGLYLYRVRHEGGEVGRGRILVLR